jgi:DNA-binding transcriptional LysR family regulator
VKLNQLEIFCKIIELGSFSKAAEALNLSQPTLSGHIQSLEDQLGILLLDRLGRKILPTRAGETLYGYAQKILRLRIEAEQKLFSLKGEFKGDLMVGASTIPGEFIVPPLIKEFRDTYSGILIHLNIYDTKKVIDNILKDEIELGIAGARVDNPKLDYHTFVKDELVLVVQNKTPWAKNRSITFENLKEIPFISREEGSGTRMIMEKTLKKQGFDITQLKVVMTLGSTTAVIQAIKSGVGCSILSRRSVEEELEQGVLKFIPIRNILFSRDFYLIIRRGKTQSPLCQAFFDYLLKKSKNDRQLY